jgi:hypothetical protein
VKKRCVFVLVAFAVLVFSIVVILTALTNSNGPGITKANLDRIQKGMTKAEVEAILGSKGSVASSVGSPHSMWILAIWDRDDGATATVEFVWIGDREPYALGPTNWTDSMETPWQRLLRFFRIS